MEIITTDAPRGNSRVAGLSALLVGSRGPVMGHVAYPTKGRMGCAAAVITTGVRVPAFQQDSFPGIQAWSPPV
jgi:hypothetical protein